MATLDLSDRELEILVDALDIAISDWSRHGACSKDPNQVDLLDKLWSIYGNR